MAINLANVNVSIQQFQSISTGKYNAGEVKLTSETTLGKVNNHVTFTGSNQTPLSHEEVLAVKNAFVKALRSGGVDRAEIDHVRVQLGLAPETGDAIDRTLGERSLRPLTRQQVREILDRNADTINGHVGAGTIRTAGERNARLGENVRNERAARRDAVNNALAESREVTSSRDVLLFERLIAGDFDGLTTQDSRRIREMARQKLAAAQEKWGGNPPDDRPLRATWSLPSGQDVEFGTRMTAAAFVAHLKDAIFDLATRPLAGNDGIIPAPRNNRINDGIHRGLNDDAKPLPHEIAELEKTLLAEARAKFGADVIPENARLRTLDHNGIYELTDRLVNEAGNQRRLGADDLRAPLHAFLEKFGTETLASSRLKQVADELGLPPRSTRYAGAFLGRNPALVETLAGAHSPAEIAAAFDNSRPAIEKFLRIGAAIAAAEDALLERAVAALVVQTGLPAPALANIPSLGGLRERGIFLGMDLASGKKPCESPEDAEAAFADAIEKFVGRIASSLEKVDSMGLSRGAAETLKQQILGLRTIKPAVYDLDKFRVAAEALKPAIATLTAALSAPGLAKADGIAALKVFAAALQKELGDRMGHLETDENFAAVHAILSIATNGDTAMFDAANAFFARADVTPADFDTREATFARSVFGMAAPAPARVNEKYVLSGLGTAKLPPLHAAALIKACRAAGLNAMSDADLLALFAPGKPAGKALAAAVKAAPVAVGPHLLEGLAAGVLRPFEGAIHDGVASAALAATERDFPPEARAHATDAYVKAGAEPWKADALIAAAFAAAGEDADVREIVMNDLDHILVNGAAQLRSEAKVREIVEQLKANFAELRQLAANDPALLDHGHALLRAFHGKTLPEGFLGKLVQCVGEQPTQALKGLSARSKGMAIHRAVAQFLSGVERAGREAGVEDTFDGPDEINPVRNFLIQRILSGLSRDDIAGLRAALHSPNGAKLLAVYGDAANIADGRNVSEGVREAFGLAGTQLRLHTFELNAALCQHLGIEEDAPQPFDGPVPRPSAFGADGLEDDLERIAREALARKKEDALHDYVRGNGPAAERLRDALSNRLGPEPAGAESILRDSFQSVVGTMLTHSILLDMKKFATGQTTQFDADRGRNFPVRLAGIGEVSRDPAAARDQFARFVTKGRKTTYAALSPAERNKANLAMSIASQGAHNAVTFGFGPVLDPQEREVKASFVARGAERSFEMEIDPSGGLSVEFLSRQSPSNIIIDNEPVACGPGSTVTMKLTLRIDAPEFERIGNVDFAAYDERPVAQLFSSTEHTPQRFRRAAQTLPPTFRLKLNPGPVLVADLR